MCCEKSQVWIWSTRHEVGYHHKDYNTPHPRVQEDSPVTQQYQLPPPDPVSALRICAVADGGGIPRSNIIGAHGDVTMMVLLLQR